jgi:hypothetical protein
MSTNINDITLQSICKTLVAKNDGSGKLIYPEYFVQGQFTEEDAEFLAELDFDNILIYIEGNEISVNPTEVYLHEVNNYFQRILLLGDGHWTISDIDEDYFGVESSTGQLEGIGNAWLDITKVLSLTAPGEYSRFFTITTGTGLTITVNVHIDVSVPLSVNPTTITLNEANNYTATVSVTRDRQWDVGAGTNPTYVIIAPMSGNGNGEITVTKSPTLVNTSTSQNRTETATFQVVSNYQTVTITVSIVIPALPPPPPPTLAFVDPRPGTDEVGATGTEPLYLYV